MSEPRVIRADYANWRPVAGRKVLQLVLEVPIEQTADVMEKLGVPMPGESKWVAVALLENGKCVGAKDDGEHRSAPKPSDDSEAGVGQTGNIPSPTSAPIAPAGTSETPPKERRSFSSLPLAQQAALRCNDPSYRQFLAQKDGPGPFLMVDLDMAADAIRQMCGVKSRADLDTFSDARERWRALEAHYESWLITQRYAGSRHG